MKRLAIPGSAGYRPLRPWERVLRRSTAGDTTNPRKMAPLTLPLTAFEEFLLWRGGDFADSRQLLAGIARELQLIRDNRLGLIFIFALRVLSLLPGGLRYMARQDRCMVSSIFSNLGRPLLRCPLPRVDGRIVAGDLVLERLDGTAPLHPYSCVTFTTMEYARRLSMMLYYDPRAVGAAQADDLAATFARRVRATLSGNG